jgi:hypothetical protein
MALGRQPLRIAAMRSARLIQAMNYGAIRAACRLLLSTSALAVPSHPACLRISLVRTASAALTLSASRRRIAAGGGRS